MTDNELERLVELHVFSDDGRATQNGVHDDDRIRAAVNQLRMWWSDTEWWYEIKGRRFGKDMDPMLLWWGRKVNCNAEYCAALEAHVSAWRAEPRPFLSDWNATMLIPSAMRDEAVLFERYVMNVLWITVRVKGDAWDILWQLDQRTIVLAALRAKGVEL